MSLQSAVFDVLVEKGPMLPAEIVREVNAITGGTTDMFFVGAILSEYMSSKKIKMSHAKVGGSKLYYCAGQEPKLIRLYDHLHEKEKKAYNQLKEQGVVRESSLEPVVRVAIKDLKDFAIPIEVKLREKEIFWKWFLMPMEEAQRLIKENMKDEIAEVKKEREERKIASEERIREREKEIIKSEPSQFFDVEANKPKNIVKNELKVKKTEEFMIKQKKTSQIKSDSNGDDNNSDDCEDSSGFILPSSGKNKNLIDSKPISNKVSTKSEANEKSVSHLSLKTRVGTEMLKPLSLNTELHEETQSTLLGASESIEDPFMLFMISLFQKNNISIISSNVIKKNSECEFEVLIDSQFGKLNFYVFSKSKKKISETDLSYAYVRAQNKNLPLCYISKGELTKKASEILESDLKAASFLNIVK